MATTKSDEGINISISKETMHKLVVIALIVIVGIVVIAGGLFIKEKVLDSAADKTIEAVERKIEENATYTVRRFLEEESNYSHEVTSMRVVSKDFFRENPERYYSEEYLANQPADYYLSLPNGIVLVEVGLNLDGFEGTDIYKIFPVEDALTNPDLYHYDGH